MFDSPSRTGNGMGTHVGTRELVGFAGGVAIMLLISGQHPRSGALAIVTGAGTGKGGGPPPLRVLSSESDITRGGPAGFSPLAPHHAAQRNSKGEQFKS